MAINAFPAWLCASEINYKGFKLIFSKIHLRNGFIIIYINERQKECPMFMMQLVSIFIVCMDWSFEALMLYQSIRLYLFAQNPLLHKPFKLWHLLSSRNTTFQLLWDLISWFSLVLTGQALRRFLCWSQALGKTFMCLGHPEFRSWHFAFLGISSYLLWTECMLLKSICWNPKLQCYNFIRWGLWEVIRSWSWCPCDGIIKYKSLSRVPLCDPRDCSLPGSSAYGILQARILEWVAIPFSRGSSLPRDWTCFTVWVIIVRWWD